MCTRWSRGQFPGVQPGTAKEPGPIAASVARGEQLWTRREADETASQIGGSDEVAWIIENSGATGHGATTCGE